MKAIHPHVATVFENVASGAMTEAELALWFEENASYRE